MTFYKKLTMVLGLCVLSNFAHAAAAADAEVEAKLKQVTPAGLVDIALEKQAELRSILVRAGAGDPEIYCVHDRIVELPDLWDMRDAPIRGGLENSIVTDNPVVIWNNTVTIRGDVGLRPGVTPDRFIGGLVGYIDAPIIILRGNAIKQLHVNLNADDAGLRRNVALLIGAYTGKMYMTGLDADAETINVLEDNLLVKYGLHLPPEPAGAAAAAVVGAGVAAAAAGGGAF